MATDPKHHGPHDGAWQGAWGGQKNAGSFPGARRGMGGQKRPALLFQMFSPGILFS